MIDIVWDMETSDPDDFLTLLFLLGHPNVNLKAITVFPGSPEQIGLVQQAVNIWFNRSIPIGGHNIDTPKPSVSQWHYDAYGDVSPSRDTLPTAELLLSCCDKNTTLLCGAPLKNLGATLKLASSSQDSDFRLGQLIIQGGFAGEGVVPHERQLEKFKGLSTYPTHNLIVDPKSVFAALSYPGIEIRRFVSKNVCHEVIYDIEMHQRFESVKDKSLALSLIYKGMDIYLQQNPAGKMLHDPLAACCAIDESIGEWAEVELYREGNEWGSRLSPGSKTWIIVDYDREKFLKTFTTY
jgi:pyrimidine-specific ribonucleoside hydrolase